MFLKRDSWVYYFTPSIIPWWCTPKSLLSVINGFYHQIVFLFSYLIYMNSLNSLTEQNIPEVFYFMWHITCYHMTRGPRTLAPCLTPAVSMTNGIIHIQCQISKYIQILSNLCLKFKIALFCKLMRYRPSTCEWPWHWSFKVTNLKVKCKHTLRLRLSAFLLMFSSNIWPTLLLYDI